MHFRTLTAVLACFASGAFASAQTSDATPPKDSRVSQIISQLGAARFPRESEISPDGRWVAYSSNDTNLVAGQNDVNGGLAALVGVLPEWGWSLLFGLAVTGLVAPATVAGVALGFGAQRIVQDLLAGFFIIAERQSRAVRNSSSRL